MTLRMFNRCVNKKLLISEVILYWFSGINRYPVS